MGRPDEFGQKGLGILFVYVYVDSFLIKTESPISYLSVHRTLENLPLNREERDSYMDFYKKRNIDKLPSYFTATDSGLPKPYLEQGHLRFEVLLS